jgi:hypothetical protein
MATNETALVKSIRAAIVRTWPDAWVVKVHGDPYQVSGVPDLLVCVRGRFVGLEVKNQRPGESEHHARERATVHQREAIDLIRKAGGTAGVVLSITEARALIESALTNETGDSLG